tara:strand:+ start:419 stop:748 length:330 start_codon:yes stop_codon:yes gene_type:complete
MNETILFFSDDDIGTGTGTGAYKASRFMGLDQTGADTATFYFKNQDYVDGEENTVAVSFSGAFKDLARAVAGVINSKKAFVVMADSHNGIYFSYPGGTLSGDPVLVQTA